MSRPGPPKKRDKYLDILPFRRSRSNSPAQPVQPADNAPASGIAAAVEPATSPQLDQAATPKAIVREDVLIRLDPEHQQVLRNYFTGSGPLDISASLQQAIDAAEEKKQLCIEKQWSITIGGKKIVLRDKINTVVDLISKFKDVGSIAAGADPIHAGLPWAGVCLLLQVVVADKEQMDALMNGIIVALSSQQTADLYLGFYHDQPAGLHADELRRSLLKLYTTVLGFLAEALRLLDASGPTRFCNAMLGNVDLLQFPSHCKDGLEGVERAAANCDRQQDAATAALVANAKIHIVEVSGQLEALRVMTAGVRSDIQLAKLPTVMDATFDSYKQQGLPVCLPGTRVDLRADITRWASDPADKFIFWLQGIAGEGKSTVAKTIATSLEASNKLGASFFFKRDESDRADAKRFFTTIAVQLAQKIDGLKDSIAKVLNDELTGYEKNMQCQFDDYIAAPLRAVGQFSQSKSNGLVIVVDALDECREGDITHVVKLLAQCVSFGIRIFVTSRPDVPVRQAFAGLEDTQFRQIVLRDHTRESIHQDIALFLEEQLRIIRRDRAVTHDDWPGHDVVQILTRRSVPLFIFAATVCRFIANDGFFTPDEQLQAVLAETSKDLLSQTYLPVLNRLIQGQSSKQVLVVIEKFRDLVGPIVLSAEPMPIDFVVRMHGLGDREQLRARFSRLHSVLHVGIDDDEKDKTIHPFHLSFRDFLVEPDEPHGFQIDEQKAHASIAHTCLSIMMQSSKLKQDIFAMGKPGTRRSELDPSLVTAHIGPNLSYACRHWIYHQVRSGELLHDTHQACQFLTQKFLYWLEAMMWLGKADEVLRTLGGLKVSLEITNSTKLLEFLEDASYFIRDYWYIADQAPLQLYASALVFAPECSHIKSTFKHCMPQWLVLPPKVPENWHHNVLVLEGDYRNSTGAMTTSFSAGSEFLAACSHDGAIRVWETVTGVCTAEMPERKSELPIALAFSHDNRYLAVAYLIDNGDHHHTRYLPPSIVIYNAKTGTPEADFRRIDVGIPSSTSLRLAFTPESSNKLLLADFYKGVLKVLSMKIDSRTIERTWSTQITWTKRSQRASFAFAADASCIAILSPHFRSITSWDLESGIVKTYSLETNTGGRPPPRRHKHFIESHGRHPVYYEAAVDSVEWQALQKLNVDTGKVEHLTHFARSWTPRAYAPATGKFAFVGTIFGGIHVRARFQDPKSNDSADQKPTPVGVVVARDARMVLVRYFDYLELRDLAGNALFTSPKAHFESLRLGVVYMSEDCKIVAARVVTQSYYWTPVWFPMSGRELQLPGMGVWACPPVVSGDGKLMAFCSNVTTDLPDVYTRVSDRSYGSASKMEYFLLRREHFLLWNLESNRRVLDFDRSYSSKIGTKWMLFSDDKSTLHTNEGNFDLKTGTWTTDNLHTRAELDRVSPISIGEDSLWLRYRGEEMLWLPEAYRPMHKDRTQFAGNTVAYACRDKSVVVMEFADA